VGDEGADGTEVIGTEGVNITLRTESEAQRRHLVTGGTDRRCRREMVRGRQRVRAGWRED
jgi:hypothetical protein